MIARHRDWLQPWASSEEGQLRFVIQALCLEAGGQRIVVDACVGPRQLPDVYAWVANDGTFIDALSDADTGVLLIGTHIPPPSAGHLVTEDGAVHFRPANSGD